MKYKLKKDLPTFKAGDEFYINDYGDLLLDVSHNNDPQTEYGITAYCRETLLKFPNILKDWFEEISEEPKTIDELKVGDTYYTLFVEKCGDIIEREWQDNQTDHSLRTFGLVFLQLEDAQKAAGWMRAKTTLERDTKGFKPNWKSCQDKWLVSYNPASNTLNVWRNMDNNGTIRFATQEDAEESIRKHEKEWKIYLGAEE